MERHTVEQEIGLELPSNFDTYDESTKASLISYLKQLDSIERQAYTIGKSHLGSCFNVIKSTGYVSWMEKQSTT